jgi:hypothetical protein
MTEDRDLLPWILGGLSMAAVAMAIAVALTGRSSPAHASSQAIPTLATADLNRKIPNGGASIAATPNKGAPTGATPTGIAPASGAPSSTAPASLVAAPSQSVAATQTPPVAASSPSGTQIWECTTNGIKTFSNSRCGSTAILRDVGPINVMDASPVASNVHWYGPDSNEASPDYYYPAPPQPADNSYPVVVGIPYLQRRRPEHPHQPNNHDRGHPRHN